MTAKGYLFDTNIAIGMMDNESQILTFIEQAAVEKQKVYFSVVTECAHDEYNVMIHRI